MKLLLVKPSSLGDVVHTFAFVNRLKKEKPEIVIDWFVNDVYSSLVRCNPAVNNVWSFKRGEWGRNWASPSTIREVFTLLSWIRRERYDVCLDLQGLLRSGLVAAFSKAAVKAGFSDAREGSRFFYGKLIHPGARPHAVPRLLGALDMFGVRPAERPDFSFRVPENAEAFVKRLLLEVGIRGPYVVFHPGARWNTKMWPPNHWRELAFAVSDKSGLPVVFSGSEADVPMVSEITSGIPGAFNFAGSLSLVELSALLRSCAIMVTVDSGPMHIAAAFDRPMVALFGPTSPERTGPVTSAPCDVLQLDVECVRCLRRRCNRRHECMEKMSPDYVGTRVMRMLAFLRAGSFGRPGL